MVQNADLAENTAPVFGARAWNHICFGREMSETVLHHQLNSLAHAQIGPAG